MNISENKLHELHQIAEKNGYKMNSQTWNGISMFYEFISPKNNIFKLKASTLLNKGWQKTDDDYLKEIEDIAKANGGYVKSSKWLGSQTPHEFVFHDGRSFWSCPSDIKKVGKSRGWPKDPDLYFSIINGRNKTDEQFLKEMHDAAIAEGGKLISQKWEGAKKLYHFEFICGTKFKLKYSVFKKNGFPKNKESYLKKSQAATRTNEDLLLELKQLAKDNECQLISNKWINNETSYSFENKEGLKFTFSAMFLKVHGWPKDLLKTLHRRQRVLMSDEERIEEMSIIANTRGGLLLEKKWLGDKVPHRFVDANNIEFAILPGNLRKGGWSVNEGLVSEPCCRQALEYLFNTKFIKTKKVLVPLATGHTSNLELDGYCEKLNIAFEYQGHPSHWDKGHDKYENKVYLDQLKKQACKNLGITLIEIPVFKEQRNKWDSANVLNHVLKSVETAFNILNKEIPCVKEKSLFKINLSNINHGIEMLAKLKQTARNYNIEVLSSSWIGSKQPYQFKFLDGREFTMQANDFMRKPPKNADNYFKRSEIIKKYKTKKSE